MPFFTSPMDDEDDIGCSIGSGDEDGNVQHHEDFIEYDGENGAQIEHQRKDIGQQQQQQQHHFNLEEEERQSPIIPQNIQLIVQNVVATCHLQQKIDLRMIAMNARNAEYNPKRFTAVIMRVREPKATALVFNSGKIVCTGARSESDCKMAARKFARIIQKIGYPTVRFTNFKIENMVGSVDVRFPIRLEGLAEEHEDYASYEPELFPGLIYRVTHPKLVVLVYVTGKIVIVGAKSREEIEHGFEHIYPILLQFKKPGALDEFASVDNDPHHGNDMVFESLGLPEHALSNLMRS